MRKCFKIDADIDTLAKDAPNIFIVYISLVYHWLTWMLWSFPAVLQHFSLFFFSKVRSHWLWHAIYHSDAQQGICHRKSGTTTAKVGLESGVPWKKTVKHRQNPNLFMSCFGVSKCNLGKTKLNDMQLIQHMWDIYVYSIHECNLHMKMQTIFWVHVIVHVCIQAHTTHTNLHIYSRF